MKKIEKQEKCSMVFIRSSSFVSYAGQGCQWVHRERSGTCGPKKKTQHQPCRPSGTEDLIGSSETAWIRIQLYLFLWLRKKRKEKKKTPPLFCKKLVKLRVKDEHGKPASLNSLQSTCQLGIYESHRRGPDIEGEAISTYFVLFFF